MATEGAAAVGVVPASPSNRRKLDGTCLADLLLPIPLWPSQMHTRDGVITLVQEHRFHLVGDESQFILPISGKK